VLEEVEADRAVWAFMTLRATHAWAEGVDAARTLLPDGEAERWEEELAERACAEAGSSPADEPPLLAALAALAAALRRGQTTPEGVAWACLCVAEWALGRGAVATALAFAQAAALARPESARLGWLAGRTLRNHGRMREAEWWLRRSVRVAVWTRDREMIARGLTALGNLCLEQGAYGSARNLHTRALRVAVRHGLREPEAMALHDLFVIACIMGPPGLADTLSRRAFQAYGPGHPSLPALAFDVAFHWMDQGFFSRALAVLHALLPHFGEPDRRFQVLTSIARAAGASEERPLFAASSAGAWSLLEEPGYLAPAAAGLLDVGRGAAGLHDWPHAQKALSHALQLATERGEDDIRLQAESAMEAARRGEVSEIPARPAGAVRSGRPADSFADELVRSLALLEEAGAGGERPGGDGRRHAPPGRYRHIRHGAGGAGR
jgi:hypothetical protein